MHVKVGPTVPIVRVDASTNTAAAWQFCSWAPDGSRGSWFWTRASFVLYRAFMLCVVLLLWLIPRRARQVSRGQRQPPPAPLDNEFLGSFRALTRVRSTGGSRGLGWLHDVARQKSEAKDAFKGALSSRSRGFCASCHLWLGHAVHAGFTHRSRNMRLQAETIARSSVNLRLGFCGQSRYSAVQGVLERVRLLQGRRC